MKKIFLFLAIPFTFFSLSAQITQEQADESVIEHLCKTTKDFTLYAKETVQTTFELTTATGEILELDYPCRVYFANFADDRDGKYVIVKESNGNVLGINTKNDDEPANLPGWRFIGRYPIEVQFDRYIEYPNPPLCNWAYYDHDTVLIINSREEFENSIYCSTYPDFDFNTHTLILACGEMVIQGMARIDVALLQNCSNDYDLNVTIFYPGLIPERWWVALITPKIKTDANIILNLSYEQYK
jgi:hypothetical protein